MNEDRTIPYEFVSNFLEWCDKEDLSIELQDNVVNIEGKPAIHLKEDDNVITCQLCGGDGEYTETRLVGDGIPGQETHIEGKTFDCDCTGGVRVL